MQYMIDMLNNRIPIRNDYRAVLIPDFLVAFLESTLHDTVVNDVQFLIVFQTQICHCVRQEKGGTHFIWKICD